MKRFSLPLLALLVALALALAGCGDADGDGATVNGSTITESTITRELNAIRNNEQYVSAVEDASQIVVVDEENGGAGGIDAAFAARVLTRQIIFKLITDEVADRGIEISDEIREQAEADLVSQVGGEDVWNQFPEDYQADLIGWNAGALALQANILGLESLDDESLEQYYEENPDQFEQACASHILVETEEEANEIKAELDAGASFGELSRRSLDTGSAEQGGELPCTFPGSFQPEFDEAVFNQPVGEVGEPVETVFGWHVILVTSREQPAFETVADDVRNQIQQLSQTEFTTWLQDALSEAEVSVNPRYGSWNDISSQVDPPDAPASPSSVPAAPETELLPEG